MPPGKARLTVLEGSSLLPGMSYHLNATKHAVGREHGVVLLDDPFVSPAHGQIAYDEDGDLWMDDEGSFNGTYLRVRERITLTTGTRFMIGRQIFQFDVLDPAAQPTDDQDTRAYGSPRKEIHMRILHILKDGMPGRAWAMGEGEVSFGRTNCTIDLSDDDLVSRNHARILQHQGAFILEDHGSTNGTFHCVRGRHKLHHGDEVYFGSHLMRVEINA